MTMSPYDHHVGEADAVAILHENYEVLRPLARAWNDATLAEPYAPGKWTHGRILVHLAQCEIVFASRLRFGLAHEAYTVQPFDQDAWMEVEPGDGRLALDAYETLRPLNLALCRALTPAQRAKRVVHPQFGDINVEWILRMFAGHERHHLRLLGWQG